MGHADGWQRRRVHAAAAPAGTGLDGSLYLTAMGGGNGWGLRRVDPGSGNVLWNYSPWPSNGMSPPSVGPDGSVYFSRSLGYLESVTPNGQSRWTFFDGSIIDHPAVSPDGSIVVAGDRPNFGVPGSIRGWNSSTGALSWQVDLASENGGFQVVFTQPRFSADSGTAYFGTAILAGGEEYSYIYAVDTGATTQCVVPAVVGMTIDAARVQVRAAGCKVMTGSGSTRAGRVIAQSPAAGTRLPLGSPVRLTVLYT